MPYELQPPTPSLTPTPISVTKKASSVGFEFVFGILNASPTNIKTSSSVFVGEVLLYWSL